MADPIYIATHYMQRKKIVGQMPTGAENPTPSEMGYKLLPGRVVDVWLYNTTATRYQPAGTFFEPMEFTDVRVATFLNGKNADASAPSDTFDNYSDSFRLKFTDSAYVPFIRDDDDRGIVTGFIEESTHGLKASDLAFSS